MNLTVVLIVMWKFKKKNTTSSHSFDKSPCGGSEWLLPGATDVTDGKRQVPAGGQPAWQRALAAFPEDSQAVAPCH